ncbi:MAG: hypothetical protein ACR2Q4_07160 [Geminicoccaceae bacterium]
MSNRMEQEFPPVTWPVMLPHDMDSMQVYIMRGRRLHAHAFNRTLARIGQAGSAAIRRGVASIAARLSIAQPSPVTDAACGRSPSPILK